MLWHPPYTLDGPVTAVPVKDVGVVRRRSLQGTNRMRSRGTYHVSAAQHAPINKAKSPVNNEIDGVISH